MTPYETLRKSLKKAAKQRRAAAASTQLSKAAAEVPRISRIMALEKQVAKKGLTDAERNNIGATLLREKLAAAAELAAARASERRAQMSAIGVAMNPGAHNPRAQTHAPFTGDYERLSPDRAATELPSQHRAGSTSVRMEGLEEALRQAQKDRDGLAIDRISQDLTFERLRDAHRAGRI